MRRILIATITICTFIVSDASTQANEDVRRVVRDVTQALIDRDMDRLSSVSASQVELSLDGAASVYTSAQARYVTSAFLDKHPIEAAEVREINIVGRNCTARYRLVGRDESRDWNLFLRLRNVERRWEIREMRLASEN